MDYIENARGNETHIILEVVKQFPKVFRAQNCTANLTKCSRWWKKVVILKLYEIDNLSLSHTYLGTRKKRT